MTVTGLFIAGAATEGEDQWFHEVFYSPYILIFYFPAGYYIAIQWAGLSAYSNFIYVYQNPLFKETLDRNNNIKLGEEFLFSLDSFLFTLRHYGKVSKYSQNGGKESKKDLTSSTNRNFSKRHKSYSQNDESSSRIDLGSTSA